MKFLKTVLCALLISGTALQASEQKPEIGKPTQSILNLLNLSRDEQLVYIPFTDADMGMKDSRPIKMKYWYYLGKFANGMHFKTYYFDYFVDTDFPENIGVNFDTTIEKSEDGRIVTMRSHFELAPVDEKNRMGTKIKSLNMSTADFRKISVERYINSEKLSECWNKPNKKIKLDDQTTCKYDQKNDKLTCKTILSYKIFFDYMNSKSPNPIDLSKKYMCVVGNRKKSLLLLRPTIPGLELRELETNKLVE